MSSLKTDFNDLMERIKTGREFGHASFEPIFYLVFAPESILEVKGYSAVSAGNIVKIVPRGEAAQIDPAPASLIPQIKNPDRALESPAVEFTNLFHGSRAVGKRIDVKGPALLTHRFMVRAHIEHGRRSLGLLGRNFSNRFLILHFRLIHNLDRCFSKVRITFRQI